MRQDRTGTPRRDAGLVRYVYGETGAGMGCPPVAGSPRFPQMNKPPAPTAAKPVDKQPVYGSVWWVPNVFQRYHADFDPSGDDEKHPMACAEDAPYKKLRIAAVIQAVPRTSKEWAMQEDAALPLITQPGDPVRCKTLGAFLCRYRMPVLRRGFSGFVKDVFMGEMSTESKQAMREKVLLGSFGP